MHRATRTPNRRTPCNPSARLALVLLGASAFAAAAPTSAGRLWAAGTNERTNLIADATRREEIEAMRADLLALMRRTADPFSEAYADRQNHALVAATLKKVAGDYAKKTAAAKQ